MVNSLETYDTWEKICEKGRILPAFQGADGGECSIDVKSGLAAVVARLDPFVYCVRSLLVLYKFVLKQLFSHNYVRVS